jgi:hypothetical protein
VTIAWTSSALTKLGTLVQINGTTFSGRFEDGNSQHGRESWPA